MDEYLSSLAPCVFARGLFDRDGLNTADVPKMPWSIGRPSNSMAFVVVSTEIICLFF